MSADEKVPDPVPEPVPESVPEPVPETVPAPEPEPEYKDGVNRPYRLSAVLSVRAAASALTDLDWQIALAVASAATVTYTYKLWHPEAVIFDEIHFGTFALNYYLGKFFMDVHPPLGKLIFYWMALYATWDGEFPTAIGEMYTDETPFLAFRFISSITGIITAAAVFFTLRAAGCRRVVAAVAPLLLVVENSIVLQSRLTVLDGYQIAFTALTVLAFKRFELATPFTVRWALLLLGTGVAVGLAVLVKLTGLFTLAWLVFWWLYQIWTYVGDLHVSLWAVLVHLVARAVGILVVPVTVYLGFFWVHFLLLTHHGPGSASVSPGFYGLFEDFEPIKADVSVGSTITIRQHGMDTYLHSHNHTYELGTYGQQVNTYEFRGDPNSEWIIETPGHNIEGKYDSKFRPIKDGDAVKLFHKQTGHYLRANDVRPINQEFEYANEVSCNGSRSDTSDNNYEWRVRIVGQWPHAQDDSSMRRLRATESVFQLHHRGTGCTLTGLPVRMPEWGFSQFQVDCMHDPVLDYTFWYIENNTHPAIDNDPEYAYAPIPAPLFLNKLMEYHNSMWRLNRSFTQKHKAASEPYTWPFALRGINYFSAGGTHIYLLGNVVVYYSGLAVLALFGLSLVRYALRLFDPFRFYAPSWVVSNYYVSMLQFALGWAVHYVPYFFMERQLFAHHYLLSVLFLVLLIGQYVDYHANLRPRVWIAALVVLVLCAFYVFWTLKALIYGLLWTVQACQAAKWMPGWDFDCMQYLLRPE